MWAKRTRKEKPMSRKTKTKAESNERTALRLKKETVQDLSSEVGDVAGGTYVYLAARVNASPSYTTTGTDTWAASYLYRRY
jgi:hypothetical protein